MNNLFSIISHFNTKGTIQEIKPLGTGLINDTYKVTTLEQDAPTMYCNALITSSFKM